MPQAELMSLFEAARWAPSAFNGQPWRFVYAHRGTADWDRLFDVLIPYNQEWVKNASVLMFTVSDRFRRAEGREPAPVYSHSFDAGAAWAYLRSQASRIGLGGPRHERLRRGQGLRRCWRSRGASIRVEAAIAVGRPTDPGRP